jgi:hypothetical protein
VSGIHGTPEQVREKLVAVIAMGANHLLLKPVSRRSDGGGRRGGSAGLRMSLQSLQDGPSGVLGGGWVLSGDQGTVDHHMRLKVGRLRIDAAVLFQHVFHEERHDVRQLDSRLL